MSGSAGGNRIPREAVEATVKDYTEKVLSKYPKYKSVRATGSYNAGSKKDFGDIDLVVHIEGEDKKMLKQDLSKFFASLPDSVIVPFKSEKYKGKKSLSSGELVTVLYPIVGMPGEFVQIDNMISTSEEESEFKNAFLDYPAEIQGLLLGLSKVICLEEDPNKIFSRLGITNVPKLEQNQEYEFNLSSQGLTLRIVTLSPEFKELERTDVWKNSNWNTIKKLFENYKIDGSFEDLLKDLSSNLTNQRSKNRVKGIFKSMVSIKSGEVNTPKGDNKQQALNTVDKMLEGFDFLTRDLIGSIVEEIAEKETIALYPGKFKPPHIGHFEVAKKLLSEADKVRIIISAKETDGITAEQSKNIWELYNKLLDNKLEIVISDISPIKYILDTIEHNQNKNFIAVYGKGEEDRYKRISKDPRYMNAKVFDGGTISVGDEDVHASNIRNLLKDRKNIDMYIPDGVSPIEYMEKLNMNIHESINEASIKKLRVFDFDDTLAHIDAKIYITHEDGSKESLTPAEYAVYEPKKGDTFNFKEFSSIIKKASPIKTNTDLLIKSMDTPNVKTTILTARALAYPVIKYIHDEYGVRPYVVGLGTSDPEKKREWVEQQIQKGYNDIKFMDDSAKNVAAVEKLKEKYPNVKLEVKLINENIIKEEGCPIEEPSIPCHCKPYFDSLNQFLASKINIEPLPSLNIISNDLENAENILGKTAHYDPNNCSITLYILNRHPKDILRSYAHEMIHRMQDNEGRLQGINTTNINEDARLKKLEGEAYLKGNLLFREWETLEKAKTPLTEGKYDRPTGLIVDKIWEYIKKSKENKKGTSAYKTKIDINGVYVELTTIIKRNKNLDFQLAVDANQSSNEIQVLIMLNPDYEPEQYNKLNAKLQDTVRHELEHTLQDPTSINYKSGKPKMTSLDYRGKIQQDPALVHRYFTLKDEIPAMVNGMYRQAKTEKQPLDVIFKEYLEYFIKSEDITQAQADKIIGVWIEYAKENLPKAQYV